MRCKKGDMAIIERAIRGENQGWVVECVSCKRLELVDLGVVDAWIVSPRPTGTNGKPAWVPDAWLRPLGNPGPDEVDTISYRPPEPFILVVHSELTAEELGLLPPRLST